MAPGARKIDSNRTQWRTIIVPNLEQHTRDAHRFKRCTRTPRPRGDVSTVGLTPIVRRLTIARTDFKNTVKIWKATRLPENIKLAPHQASIVQAAIHGCQA